MTATAPTYRLHNIPDGREGIRATLKLMSQIVKRYKASPVVRELALDIVADLPQKKWRMEAAALLRWVQQNIRYVKDIRGVETLQTPPQTLRLQTGDCDDTSILYASLLESVGHPTRFIAVGFTPDSLSHVLVQTKIAGKWLSAETIMDWPLGRAPQGVKNMMTQHN